MSPTLRMIEGMDHHVMWMSLSAAQWFRIGCCAQVCFPLFLFLSLQYKVIISTCDCQGFVVFSTAQWLQPSEQLNIVIFYAWDHTGQLLLHV